MFQVSIARTSSRERQQLERPCAQNPGSAKNMDASTIVAVGTWQLCRSFTHQVRVLSLDMEA